MISIRIYNTLTQEKSPFIPLAPNKVGIYVCGVTVYDSSHIGHARAAVVFDVVCRFFREMGYEVTYIRNFTDIDDKIIQRSQELEMDYRSLTQKYIDQYEDEMKQLNVLSPTRQPRATEHINDMINIVEGLVQKKMAYVKDGDVFYDVSRMRGYGKLSKRSIDDMRSGARVEVDTRKDSPEDFALWKAAKPDEPSWDSPWGKGRPGWHIECSAMSMHYLGKSFDIHGGGCDLVFPHHENEIAQSEAFTGKTYAHCWMHNELVTIQQSKMSKSLGNVFFLNELFEKIPPRVVRYFIISKHYRTPIEFSMDALKEASLALERIESTLARAVETMGSLTDLPRDRSWTDRFYQALADDFNTPRAIGVVFQLLAQVNRNLDKGSRVEEIKTELGSLQEMLNILGIEPDLQRFVKITEAFSYDKQEVEGLLSREEWTEKEMQLLVKMREGARKNKQWDIADLIRDQLSEKGFEIRDEKDGAKVIKIQQKNA